MSTYNNIDSIFPSKKERKFVDREAILAELNKALLKQQDCADYFHIYQIHGAGGMGKTHLAEFFRKSIDFNVIYLSFEIEKRDDAISNLYKIRREINMQLPLFDFALLRYWEMTQPTRINDDFMKLFSESFFTDFLKIVDDLTGVRLSPPNISYPGAASPSGILNFINILYKKVPQLLNSSIIKRISVCSSSELEKAMPRILGHEIRAKIDSQEIPNKFIFDSYQANEPYSESREWLYHLISAIGIGLFIVTSREKLKWPKNQLGITTLKLDCYPESAARELLEVISDDQQDLVQIIIDATQCIPIYVNLALDIYEKESNICGNMLVDKALFSDRSRLVENFVSHLKKEWQDAVIDLATIQIFDRNIFEFLVKERMLSCNAYDYDSLISSNLFSYLTTDTTSGLVKLHDVFCRDIRRIRQPLEQRTIFGAYLKIIRFRSDRFLSIGANVLVTLFLNLLTIINELGRQLEDQGNALETEDIEGVLDVFFILVSNKIQFTPPSVKDANTIQTNCLFQLIYAKMTEKDNTLMTIRRLEEIENPEYFGKHKYSYEAVLNYARSLCGQYNQLQKWISNIEVSNQDDFRHEWFYNRVKIYQADCDMMDGKFKDAYSSLLLLKNGYMSEDDEYTISRTIGHIFRFNMQLEHAHDIYEHLLTENSESSVYSEYLKANLCETGCYFPTKSYAATSKATLNSMSTPYNTKNKGKVLYSLAIAYTVFGHYKKAQEYISQCTKINREDGYQSGILFGLMAQAFLDFAMTNSVSKKTIQKIESLLVHNKVYLFFRLPLAIMENDENRIQQIAHQFSWLDFSSTTETWRIFLAQIGHRR